MSETHQCKRIFVDQLRCLGCKTCEIRCAVERGSVSKNLTEAVNEAVTPSPRVYVGWNNELPVPIQCRHCEDAPCLEICSTGAMQRDAETGCTYVNEQKCIACWMCVMTCPYGVINPNAQRKLADKCDQCYQMPKPHCVESCPTGALSLMSPEEYMKYLVDKRDQNNSMPTKGDAIK